MWRNGPLRRSTFRAPNSFGSAMRSGIFQSLEGEVREMEILTKFSIGDEVFIITSGEAYRLINCVTCQRSGKVIIDAASFICPACQGRSAHRRYAGQRWYVGYMKARVGKITVEAEIDESWRRSSHGSRPDFAYESHGLKVSYMCDQTGIGSGTCWEESRLFKTLPEAVEECARRNSGLRSDEDEAALLPETR